MAARARRPRQLDFASLEPRATVLPSPAIISRPSDEGEKISTAAASPDLAAVDRHYRDIVRSERRFEPRGPSKRMLLTGVPDPVRKPDWRAHCPYCYDRHFRRVLDGEVRLQCSGCRGVWRPGSSMEFDAAKNWREDEATLPAPLVQ